MAATFMDQLRAHQALVTRIDSIEDPAERTAAIAQEDTVNRNVLIAGLTGTTAVLHVALGTQIFVLNGIGYLALLAAHYATPERESYRKYTRDALFGYTSFTVVAYFAARGTSGFLDPTGVASKLIELGLLRVLWADRAKATTAAWLAEETTNDGN